MFTYDYFILSGVHAFDGQTDGQTDRQTSTAIACSNRVRCQLKRTFLENFFLKILRTRTSRLSWLRSCSKNFELCKADDIFVTVIVIVDDLTYADPRMLDHVGGTSANKLVSFQHVQYQVLHTFSASTLYLSLIHI